MQGEATLNAVELFVALVAVAALVALVARRIAVPYTVALVVFGLGGALLAPRAGFGITEELVLAVLLPGLIFEAAYQTDLGSFRRAFGGIALLAAPGVLITAAIVALVLLWTVQLPFELGFVVGAMVAATDPAAVVSTFKRLRSPKQLATLVEGESLLNDGTALVVFAIALRAVTSEVSPGEALLTFAVTIIVSTAIGAVIGVVASRIVATVDDHLIELTISLATAYGAYLVADMFHESGVIATVVAGMVLGTYGRRIGMSQRTREALDTVWEFLAFLLTALVFLLVGLAISVPQLLDALPAILWTVVAITVGRAVAVYGLVGGTSRLVHNRYHSAVPLAWLHVMFWAGLRGAVAVAMALSLPADFPQRDLLREITYGVVLFTLLVQGTTTDLVIRWTGAGADEPEPGTESDEAPA